MNAAREFQLEVLLDVVMGPAALFLIGWWVTRNMQSAKLKGFVFALVVGLTLFLSLGTPFVRVGVHSEDLVVAALLAALVYPHGQPQRGRFIATAAIFLCLGLWLLWPNISGRIPWKGVWSISTGVFWLVGFMALWALNHAGWRERDRFLTIGLLCALTIGAALDGGSARTAQACGALGIICAGAGLFTLRQPKAPTWALHNALAVSLFGLTAYQLQYGELDVACASAAWSLPILALFAFRLSQGFGGPAVMTGLLAGVIALLTLSPWRLNGTGSVNNAERPGGTSTAKDKINGYDDSNSKDDLPAPPEAKSEFKTGYE